MVLAELRVQQAVIQQLIQNKMAIQLKSHKMEVKTTGNPVLRLGNLILAAMLTVFITILSFHANAESGKDIFNKACMTCHQLTDKRTVGPGLQGVGERRSEEWLIKWVKNSQDLINSGDADAKALYEEYGMMIMPSFSQYSDDDIKGILAFIKEEGDRVATTVDAGGGSTAPTASSGGDGALSAEPADKPIDSRIWFWGIISAAVIGYLMYRFKKRTTKAMNEMGYYPDAHKVENYPGYLVMYIGITCLIAYLLVSLLKNNTGMIDSMMFVALPYVSILIFLIGSIYRYKTRGFQVSSLSSQFIEGKKLFWGSLPFHLGLMFLFFGHLIAFIFPKAVLAWNGEPVRLLILEISSFAFGLSALVGVILLIKRRLLTKSLLVTTNKMDMIVYTVLITQIVSGLGVAFFVRWGSSWFSSVLTPYLRSVFSFNPDITAVSELPWWIQLHIISAFSIIALIPFTRFMHFLVAPIDYAWRKYQIVLWNWNRKSIRSSSQHTFGKKPRNH